jgi:hypothetical protein
MLGWERLAPVRHRGYCRSLARGAVNVLVMDVAERENKLHRQREERQPAAESLVRPEPPHHANSGLIAHSQECRAVYDAAAVTQLPMSFSRAGTKRLIGAVTKKQHYMPCKHAIGETVHEL